MPDRGNGGPWEWLAGTRPTRYSLHNIGCSPKENTQDADVAFQSRINLKPGFEKKA